jgi:hypothetical protein
MYRTLTIRSYSAGLFLMAKGIEPLGAELARDGSHAQLFIFPGTPEASAALDAYHRTKDRLHQLVADAGAR